MLVMKRLNANNPNFAPEDLEWEVKKKNVKSRFLKKPEKTLEDELQELRNERRKQGLINASVHEVDTSTAKERRPTEKVDKREYMNNALTNKTMNSDSAGSMMWKPALKWPENYDDLPPIERPKPAQRPLYYGWTHSDDVDSWYLESHTPGSHDTYNRFYENLYGKRAICPKLWDTVFPETERHVSSRNSL